MRHAPQLPTSTLASTHSGTPPSLGGSWQVFPSPLSRNGPGTHHRKPHSVCTAGLSHVRPLTTRTACNSGPTLGPTLCELPRKRDEQRRGNSPWTQQSWRTVSNRGLRGLRFKSCQPDHKHPPWIRATRARNATGDDLQNRPSHIASHIRPKKNTPTATPCSGYNGNTSPGRRTTARLITPTNTAALFGTG